MPDFGALVRDADELETLEYLFRSAPDDGSRYDVVVRALKVREAAGVELALEFLRRDPPIFFRQTVIDVLGGMTGKTFDYDASEPFSFPANKAAAGGLASEFGLAAPRSESE
jgi:hypothetical protein